MGQGQSATWQVYRHVLDVAQEPALGSKNLDYSVCNKRWGGEGRGLSWRHTGRVEVQKGILGLAAVFLQSGQDLLILFLHLLCSRIIL